MSYQLAFSKGAKEQMALWVKSGQKKTLLKIRSLLKELEDHPATGSGQVERLKDETGETYSRRIDKKNRLVYTIFEDKVLVNIKSLMGHYTDK